MSESSALRKRGEKRIVTYLSIVDFKMAIGGQTASPHHKKGATPNLPSCIYVERWAECVIELASSGRAVAKCLVFWK